MTPVHAKDLFRGGSLRFREPDRPVAAKQVTHAPVVPQRVTPPSIQCGCQRIFVWWFVKFQSWNRPWISWTWRYPASKRAINPLTLEFFLILTTKKPDASDDNNPRFSVTVGGLGAAVGTVPQLLAATFRYQLRFLCSSIIYITVIYPSYIFLFYPFSTHSLRKKHDTIRNKTPNLEKNVGPRLIFTRPSWQSPWGQKAKAKESVTWPISLAKSRWKRWPFLHFLPTIMEIIVKGTNWSWTRKRLN